MVFVGKATVKCRLTVGRHCKELKKQGCDRQRTTFKRIQSTMTSRGNATSWPLFPQREEFSRDRQQQSINHFNLRVASKLKFLNFYMFTHLHAK